MSVMLNRVNKTSNHRALNTSFIAELVPKSFSINVATPIETAKTRI